MRIMFVLVSIARGGAENVMALLANSFVKNNHNVLIACNKSREELKDFYPLDEKINIVKCFGENGFFHRCQRIRSVVRSGKPDVIIGIMGYSAIYGYVGALGRKIKVISSDHSSFEKPDYVKQKIVPYFVKHYVNKIYDCVTVITDADKRFIGSRFRRTVVMPNPLSASPLTNIQTNRSKRILAVGRLDAWHCKGFDLLISAWSKLQSEYPEWTLEIAGDGADGRIYLEKMISNLNIQGRVNLSGFHLNIQEKYRESEIFVLSSRYEGFGMALIEAMSQGCACIACDYKGRQREIIENETQGLCIPPEQLEQLCSAIKRMIEDESYRASVRLNAIERSKFYLSDKIASKWIELLEDLV